MKILYVCCNFVWGGVEQYILNVIDNIDKEHFDIDVLLPEKDKYEREEDLILRNVKVIKYPCNTMGIKIKSFMKVVKEGNYDVIHFHTGHESALLCMLCYMVGNKNVIVHAHTTQSGDENCRRIHLLKKRVIYTISNIIYRNMACCVACSIDAAQFMFGTHAKRTEILMNGIDLNRFRQLEKKKTEYSFCINARIDTQKNPFFVLEIMKELVKIEPLVYLEWIGQGPLERQLKQKISDYGLDNNISLLGVCNDVEKVLARNKYFLFPSLYEGLGIVLIEAQVAGLKCFISETIPENANCGGCKVIPLSLGASEWAKNILTEIHKKDDVIINAERLKEFDITQTVKKLESIYAEYDN